MALFKKDVFLDEFVARLTLALINAPKGFSSNWWVSDEGLSPSALKKVEIESDYLFLAMVFLVINNLRSLGKIKKFPRTLSNEETGSRIGEILFNSLLISYKYLKNADKEAEKLATRTSNAFLQYIKAVEDETTTEMVELELSTVFADRVMGKDSDRANPNHSNLVDLGAQLVERNQKEIQQMFSRVRLMYRPYSEFRNVKYQV